MCELCIEVPSKRKKKDDKKPKRFGSNEDFSSNTPIGSPDEMTEDPNLFEKVWLDDSDNVVVEDMWRESLRANVSECKQETPMYYNQIVTSTSSSNGLQYSQSWKNHQSQPPTILNGSIFSFLERCFGLCSHCP